MSACSRPWCTGGHDHDNERVAHNAAIITDNRIDGATVTVVALWAERLGGRARVEPHVTVLAPGGLHADLTPREASTWSALLTTIGGPVWLAEALAAGAAMLAPHDDQEHDGKPHYVTDEGAQR